MIKPGSNVENHKAKRYFYVISNLHCINKLNLQNSFFIPYINAKKHNIDLLSNIDQELWFQAVKVQLFDINGNFLQKCSKEVDYCKNDVNVSLSDHVIIKVRSPENTEHHIIEDLKNLNLYNEVTHTIIDLTGTIHDNLPNYFSYGYLIYLDDFVLTVDTPYKPDGMVKPDFVMKDHDKLLFLNLPNIGGLSGSPVVKCGLKKPTSGHGKYLVITNNKIIKF